MKRDIAIAKYTTIAAFLVLLCSTYYLRAQVLKLNTIRLSSENIRTEEVRKNLKESLPARQKEYEMRLTHYQTEQKHYEDMLDLYQTNYEEYVKRVEDKFSPPMMPQKPQKPISPELSDQLTKVGVEFRDQQYHYFNSTSKLNWIACIAALSLVGGLLYLLMFDVEGKRIFYIIILVLSFIFMIGPSFHSIMSAVVGFLQAPQVMHRM
jgi:hypothetical protein